MMPGRSGQIFGSYELIRSLGRGGFAEVYLGKHTQLPQQMAAVKILEKQLIQAKSQQFKKEASIVATLRHPHIVQMYDYNVYSNQAMTLTLIPFIVMEYAPNGSLRQKHPRGLPLPLTTIVMYTRQIADALQHAHDHNVMHLDVKPENILVNGQNQLLLSDFGLATLLSEQDKTADIQGTLSYMSPEQLNGKPDFASDQYALGVMVYEWICGHLPFSGRSVKEVIDKHLNELPPSLCTQVSALSQQAESVVMRALEKKTQDRYPSVHEFTQMFEQAVNNPGAPANAYANNFSPPNQATPFQGTASPLPPWGSPAQADPFVQAIPNKPSPFNAPPDPNAGPFMAGPPPGANPQPFIGSPFDTSLPPTPYESTVFDPMIPGGHHLPPGQPYGNRNIMQTASATASWDKSLTDATKTFLKPPPGRVLRQRRPMLIAGLAGDMLGALFIGIWVGHIVPSYGNNTAWWSFIFAALFSLGGSYLFFSSGNKGLNVVLSFLLAIYGGFVGNAFAALIGAGINVVFLPDADIMAVVFFASSLLIHLSLTFKRK
jgi:serine/threonine protein kinase